MGFFASAQLQRPRHWREVPKCQKMGVTSDSVAEKRQVYLKTKKKAVHIFGKQKCFFIGAAEPSEHAWELTPPSQTSKLAKSFHSCSVNMNGNKFTFDQPPWGTVFVPTHVHWTYMGTWPALSTEPELILLLIKKQIMTPLFPLEIAVLLFFSCFHTKS